MRGEGVLIAGGNFDKFFPLEGNPYYQYQLRCELPAGAKLKRLAVINDLQMALLALPEMTVGKNSFTYSDKSSGERNVRITHEWVERSTSKPPEAPGAVYPPDGGQAEGTDFAFRWSVPKDPDGDKITDYFRKYQSSQSQLNGILHSLRNGQDELTKDNVALNLEKTNLWAVMGRLNQYVYVAERLDAKLAAKIAELELSDPEAAKALSQDVLFYVRQKHQDLLTQLAVSIQNYLAIDIIMKNNIELIKGVDRATTTTVSALRTAVIVAQALANQKLVLDQITALNTTTSGMIQRTSEMLKENSAAIQEQAASSTIGIEQLQAAFANIYATMDSIDEFKLKALDNMSTTIGVLETEVQKSKSYLERVQKHDARNAQGALDLSSVPTL